VKFDELVGGIGEYVGGASEGSVDAVAPLFGSRPTVRVLRDLEPKVGQCVDDVNAQAPGMDGCGGVLPEVWPVTVKQVGRPNHKALALVTQDNTSHPGRDACFATHEPGDDEHLREIGVDTLRDTAEMLAVFLGLGR
jgi:hypothetical protein